MTSRLYTTGNEVFFDDDDIIVSKTNTKGILTYTNRIFLNIAGYAEKEVVGQQHSIIRHPDMPRCIFKLLWDTLQNGQEIFAYVINRCKNGDHYWVYAHVTPSWDQNGRVIGYHSNRRVPDRKILDEAIIPLYQELKATEDASQNRKDGLKNSTSKVSALLAARNLAYDEYILTLGKDERAGFQ